MQLGLNDGTGVFAPADSRWLSGHMGCPVRAPMAARFGAQGEPGVVSYRLFGRYGRARDQT